MKVALIIIGTMAIAIVAWVIGGGVCLYDGWYKDRSGRYAKRFLIAGCVIVVIGLVATAELVVELANCGMASFTTGRSILLETVEFDNQTETIRWVEPGGEEQQASLYSVKLVFGDECPQLYQTTDETRQKTAVYLFGLKEIHSASSSVGRTFFLPKEKQDEAKNGFKKP